MAGNPGDDRDGGGAAVEEGDAAVLPEAEKKLQKPRLFKVLLHNDDYTTMEFVVMVLQSVVRHSEPEAVQIMLQVHQQGVGVAGIYSYEIAETKASKVTELARQNEFPLRATVEPE
jgi:ATP-dependent Clp protease adaptor protein ClpS